uniref:Uncharacterized protein LOC102801701 n=1 Tax=Saccoglossus kowalevskii TaxID=10224 RepID=A0ABM0MYE9_SACKO|nr:PREDICTED: uncharacterized protein LOC102801701 [Saccoglossus kowalevskii]
MTSKWKKSPRSWNVRLVAMVMPVCVIVFIFMVCYSNVSGHFPVYKVLEPKLQQTYSTNHDAYTEHGSRDTHYVTAPKDTVTDATDDVTNQEYTEGKGTLHSNLTVNQVLQSSVDTRSNLNVVTSEQISTQSDQFTNKADEQNVITPSYTSITDIPTQDSPTNYTFPATTVSVDKSPHQITNTTYLLMVAFINPNSGPQNHYRRLRLGLAVAMSQNRSYVTYPFRNHITDTDRGRLRTFNETWDINKLNQLIPVIEHSTLYSKCKEDIAIFNDHPSQNIITGMQRDIGVAFSRDDVVDKHCTPRNVCVEDMINSRCLIIGDTVDFVDWTSSQNLSQWLTLIDKYLMKAPYIVNIAGDAVAAICNQDPFLVFHWRNHTGERCKFWNLRGSICDPYFLSLVDYADRIAHNLLAVMSERNAKCLYIAYPPFSEEIANILRPYIQTLVTRDDLFVRVPTLSPYHDDNYVISLIEQEIAVRADCFLGNRGSGWSIMTSYARRAIGKDTMWLHSAVDMPKPVHSVNKR